MLAFHPESKPVPSSDQFSTLVTALKTAGLVGTLQSDGPFTVFAPTNGAFAKLDDATLRALLQPENKGKLTDILTYHAVAGNFLAKDVINAVKASGGTFTIETASGGRQVGSDRRGQHGLADR